MAVKIRLRRMGAKKAPFYRVVVADFQVSERRQIYRRNRNIQSSEKSR